ncbi:MAG: 2-C-methyl-D-erythritol 4-phosphate cytidylyltransferase [Actinomycetota bacterium]|nr:2-C-methyl-D-erythritol 4-phosphate cytidylyltransferase [Actinomycetota bacterium]
MTTTAILVAAGAGERLGTGRPKALVELAGEPLLVHAARALRAATSVDHLVVVLPMGADVTPAAALLNSAGWPDAALCEGGPTRQSSVSAGLSACPRDSRVIAVHDAARPLVSPRLIDRTVASLTAGWDAVAPGLVVADTLKLVDSTRQVVLRTVDRRGVWAVQTPQVFGRVTLDRVHARIAPSADAATDDLSLVERAGGRVRLIEGERSNIKVTFPTDLAFAERLLAGDRL